MPHADRPDPLATRADYLIAEALGLLADAAVIAPSPVRCLNDGDDCACRVCVRPRECRCCGAVVASPGELTLHSCHGLLCAQCNREAMEVDEERAADAERRDLEPSDWPAWMVMAEAGDGGDEYEWRVA